MEWIDVMGYQNSWVPLTMFVVTVALWAGLIVAVLRIMRMSLRGRGGLQPERAVDVLECRYASGEIDAETFRRMKLDLKSTASSNIAGEPSASLHLVTQARSAREVADLDWGPRPVA
jgi:hypothetical protein